MHIFSFESEHLIPDKKNNTLNKKTALNFALKSP